MKTNFYDCTILIFILNFLIFEVLDYELVYMNPLQGTLPLLLNYTLVFILNLRLNFCLFHKLLIILARYIMHVSDNLAI